MFDRRQYRAAGGEELVTLAEEYLLGSTADSRSRHVEIADTPGAGGLVSGLIAQGLLKAPGLSDPTAIDLVAESPDGEVALFVIEDRPWGVSPRQGEDLAHKVAAYCDYIEDGRLRREYPSRADRAPLIRLDCATVPTPEIREALAKIIERLTSRGIRFLVRVDPGLAPSDSGPTYRPSG